MRLPEPGGELGIFNVDGVLAKAGFNPDEARDERGQWTRDGDANVEASNTDRNPGVQLADAGLSDVVGNPVAEASARAAASSHRVAATDNSRNRSAGGAPKGFWEAVSSGLSSNVESVLSEIGQAQETQINSERTATAAEGNAALESLDAVNQFLERPAGGSTPITPEFPMWGGYGMDMTLAPTRPITVGDEVGAAANLFSLLPIGEGGSAALELSELATAERETFLAPYPEWQAHFKARWPAGRIVFPPDLPQGSASIGNYAHREIGRLFQEAHSDVRMILRTDPPNQPGVDIEIHVSDVPKVGFRYGEIKPATASGVKECSRNVRRWQKPEPVLPITYDRAGNVYYGFPVITEPDGD